MNYSATERSLFLGDLSVYCTEQDIFEIFRTFGPIESIQLKRKSVANGRPSYGFIQFSFRESAEQALRAMNGRVIHGRAIRLGWAEPPKVEVKIGVKKPDFTRPPPAVNALPSDLSFLTNSLASLGIGGSSSSRQSVTRDAGLSNSSLSSLGIGGDRSSRQSVPHDTPISNNSFASLGIGGVHSNSSRESVPPIPSESSSLSFPPNANSFSEKSLSSLPPNSHSVITEPKSSINSMIPSLDGNSFQTPKGGLDTAQVHFSYVTNKVEPLKEEVFRTIFQHFGPVMDVAIKKSQYHPDKGVQTGYGFIHFPLTDEGIACALESVKSLHELVLDSVKYSCRVSHALEEYLKSKQNNRRPANFTNFFPSSFNPFGSFSASPSTNLSNPSSSATTGNRNGPLLSGGLEMDRLMSYDSYLSDKKGSSFF